MSMRDQIAFTISKNITLEDGVFVGGFFDSADAILEALPDMIAPLVWVKSKNGNVCTTEMILGLRYRLQISLSGKAMWSVNTDKRWHNAVDKFEAEVHINTHHRDAIMAAFTGETK
jgi:hypothetical protein